MSADDVNKGREILNTELPVNSQDAVFVFNNYGIIDPYFEGLKRFNLIGIDVQDGVLAREVRMYSPETVPFTVDAFWRGFNEYIDEILIST